MRYISVSRAQYTGIILGGGMGRRMGGPKLFAEHQGVTFAAMIAATARTEGLDLLWVLSSEAQSERLFEEVGEAQVTVNPIVGGDMFSSILAGARALHPHNRGGAIIWPVDFPLIATDTVALLLRSEPSLDILIPECNGRGGHPLRLSRRALTLALSTVHEGGLRSFLHRTTLLRGALPVGDSGIHRNCNTPSSLQL